MKHIKTVDGYTVTVSDQDYRLLSQFQWYTMRGKGHTRYARTVVSMHRLVLGLLHSIKGGLRARRYDNGIRGRRVTTREVTGIDQDVKLNRALWQLAEAMAQLKGGK